MEEKRIRPHHALCAQFFIGKGYSPQFVEHMYRTLQELGQEGSKVVLTDGCDHICTACPNNIGGVCETDDKVRAIDGRALEAMGLKYGDSVQWRELCTLAKKNVIDSGKLKEVCGNCEWMDICSARS